MNLGTGGNNRPLLAFYFRRSGCLEETLAGSVGPDMQEIGIEFFR